jgi:hypothetical protein
MHGTRLHGVPRAGRHHRVGLTVHIGIRARRTLPEKIQRHRPGIEVLGYETGGGIFGPPIRGWHRKAEVIIAAWPT